MGAVKVTVRKCLLSINFPTRTITLMDLQCLRMIKHDYFQTSVGTVNSPRFFVWQQMTHWSLFIAWRLVIWKWLASPLWCFLSNLSDIISFPLRLLDIFSCSSYEMCFFAKNAICLIWSYGASIWNCVLGNDYKQTWKSFLAPLIKAVLWFVT